MTKLVEERDLFVDLYGLQGTLSAPAPIPIPLPPDTPAKPQPIYPSAADDNR